MQPWWKFWWWILQQCTNRISPLPILIFNSLTLPPHPPPPLLLSKKYFWKGIGWRKGGVVGDSGGVSGDLDPVIWVIILSEDRTSHRSDHNVVSFIVIWIFCPSWYRFLIVSWLPVSFLPVEPGEALCHPNQYHLQCFHAGVFLLKVNDDDYDDAADKININK